MPSQSLPGTQETDLVTSTIKINGTAIGMQYQVASIVVQNEVNRIPSAKIILYDGDAAAQDFEVSNEATFVPGAEIEITVGYHSNETSIFSGIILKHSLKIRSMAAPMLILDCRDKAVKMTIARKNKYFANSSDSDAVSGIIGDYQLTSSIDDTQIQLESIVQYDCTDWDFILSRMEANGMVCITSAGNITAKKPDLTGSTVLDAVYGATILEFDADLDARYQYGGITAKTWDQANQAISTATANEPGYVENGNVSYSDLSNVLGVTDYDLNVGEEVTTNELQNWADARLEKARLSRCRGRVRFRGYAPLNPADLINLGGVGDRFNGTVYASAIRHEVAKGVWTTDVQFGLTNDLAIRQPEFNSPPAAEMLPAVQGLQIGIVTKLENDPNSENRIQVRLPIVDPNQDGNWMRIASLDAGNNRGMFFLPEIGDEVIVGFINNDPRHPVVLGMLNSSAKPAPLTASNQNDEKGYTSRSGMTMTFNDSDKSLIITTPAGKKVTIDEQAGVISLEDENNNKISMDSSSVSIVSGKDISIKATGDVSIEGVNVNVKASSAFSLDAGGSSLDAGNGSASLKSSMVDVEGSAQTTIKGGMVMIN
jgi:Rhs element Vgr protein